MISGGMNMQHESDRQKKQIVGLYHRVASTYGQVGPNPFSYAGQQLVKYMEITEGKRVLDVATGRGANLFPAAEVVGPRGEVVGIDLAEGMVQETMEAIRQRGLQNATVMQMDAEELTFDSASFDYVLCSFALFLFPHLEYALGEFLRVLCAGGKLGVTFAKNPDPLSLWYGERLTAYHQRYQFPLRAGGNDLQPAQLPELLINAGFSDVQVFYEDVTFWYASPQEWWDARWTHGTRYALEHMPAEALTAFKDEVLARVQETVQPEGVPEQWQFIYTLALEPS